MSYAVFDTETISLNKPFCYNIGYIIYNNLHEEVLRREFVIEQVWHNTPLFETAYYAEKRPLYVNAMRGRKAILEKFGFVTQTMARDFKYWNVGQAYAYNASFDEKVFDFNCEWFKVINPFDNVMIFDLLGMAQYWLADSSYKQFCEAHELFTDSGNYSTTAEAMGKFIYNNPDFIEAHTALSDCEVESAIMRECIKRGADRFIFYQKKISIPRYEGKLFTLKDTSTGKVLWEGKSFQTTWSKTRNKMTIRTLPPENK